MLNRVVILIISIILLGVMQLGGVISSLSDRALDALFLLRGPTVPSEEIIIIGVDEESLAELGVWPFPREYHATLLHRLDQAKVIGFDILFSEPTAQDLKLSKAMAESPPVILAVAHNYQNRILQPTSSLNGYSGLGHIEIILSKDGVVREANPFQQSGQFVIPTFALAILNAAGVPQNNIATDKTILINHYGPEITFLYLSYCEVLQGKIPKDFFKDRFVLIGAEALGIGDSHVTPFSSEYPTPGVEIQATILNNLLEETSLQKIQSPSWFFVICIVLFNLFLWPSQGERWNWIINICLVTILLFSSCILFRFSLFVNPVMPLLFLCINFAVYLIMERLWTAKKIFTEMHQLDRQLETQLQRVYTNIPTKFFNPHPAPATKGGLKRHLAHLQAGVKVLSLQHHFIENILREELLPLILWDKHNGNVIIANSNFITFWKNHSMEQVTLPTLEQFIHLLQNNQQTGEHSQLDTNTLLQNNTPIPALDIALTEQGLKKYFRITMQLFEVSDIEFNGVLAILTDVSEIKELERLKDNIVSIVSHELKLPLTVILGYGEMLADTLQGEKKQYIDEICSQTQRLNRLIEDFLDVARLEHNRHEIRRFPVDLIRLIKEAKNTMLIPAEKKSITVQAHLPFRATPLIGDNSLLFQAVTNLLDNAIKFSPSSSLVTIKLTEEVDRFILCISDQGPGVSSESQEEIFDTFNRGREVLAADGFGLGLSFVKQVVQKHNGKIWLEADNSCGACFCLTLPKRFDN